VSDEAAAPPEAVAEAPRSEPSAAEVIAAEPVARNLLPRKLLPAEPVATRLRPKLSLLKLCRPRLRPKLL